MILFPIKLVGINLARFRLTFKCNSVLQTFEASSCWSVPIFIPLCISYAIISRYCYKHDIKMHKYVAYQREYAFFMHWRCRTCRDQATRGISWAMREGRGYPSKYPKAEKGPISPRRCSGKGGNRLLPSLLPPQTQSYQRFAGF